VSCCPANLLKFSILKVQVMLLRQNDQYAELVGNVVLEPNRKLLPFWFLPQSLVASAIEGQIVSIVPGSLLC
jgi:hypothetical protein